MAMSPQLAAAISRRRGQDVPPANGPTQVDNSKVSTFATPGNKPTTKASILQGVPSKKKKSPPFHGAIQRRLQRK